ncbi:MAG: 2-oxo acid dehydrogenase subunit E2 [Candidatus Woesearchaeota archaeon]
MYEFLFPDVGEGLTEGVLVKWLVKPGDSVKQDQPVAEVETDKAVVELPSPVAGKVNELLHKEHDTIIVGKPLMTFETTEQPAQKEEKKEVVKTSGTIKPTVSAKGLALPKERKLARDKGIDLSTVQGTGPNGRITEQDILHASGATRVTTGPNISATKKDILATPSTRQLAREKGVDINAIKGTGELGRITKEDIENLANGTQTAKPTQNTPLQGKRIPITGLRNAIAQNLMRSQKSTAHVTHTDTIDVTELVAIRDREKDKVNVRLSYLPFFLKACVKALEKHPYMNANVDDSKNEIVLSAEMHFGIAVDTERGLLVPVIRDADKKNILELAESINSIAETARSGKMQAAEMQGSTFTITSIGNVGGDAFTPIINYPNIAILGIGTVKDKPAVFNGDIAIRKLCVLSLTYDHRIVDGAEAARFMNDLKTFLEDPEFLLLT